jgi:hypothetical protein
LNVLCDERALVKKYIYVEEAVLTVIVAGKSVDDRLSSATSAEAKYVRPKIKGGS